MGQIFDKIKTKCVICGTPLNGEDIDLIDGKYYCRSDFEKASPQEKAANKSVQDTSDFLKQILKTDTGQLLLNHDFNNWILTNAIATSAKVFTGTAANSKATKTLSLDFGEWYLIKVVGSANTGNINCYNSNDGTKLLGTNSFEDRFIALTDYIEFRNSSNAVNTVSFIEVRKL